MSMRSKALAVGMGALLVAITATTALAGHQSSGVKSYTGCLVPKDGVIIKIKEGESPASPCTGASTLAHFSGGDITKISVGSGLSTTPTDGANGEVRIELDASHSLPQGCVTGQVVKWVSGAWACRTDNDTTYDDGIGLDLSASNVFSIEPDYLVKNTPDCSSGQFATGFESNGDIRCAAPPSAGAVQVFASTQSPESGIGIPSDSNLHDVVTLTVPLGMYSISAIGNGSQSDQRAWELDCSLFAGSTQLSEAVALVGTDQPGGGIDSAYSMSMASIRSFTGSTVLKVACQTATAGVGAEHFVIQAIKFG